MQTRITYWPRGCAHPDGPATLIVDGFLDAEDARRELVNRFLPTATVLRVSAVGMRPVPVPITEDYQRTMSRFDNS